MSIFYEHLALKDDFYFICYFNLLICLQINEIKITKKLLRNFIKYVQFTWIFCEAILFRSFELELIRINFALQRSIILLYVRGINRNDWNFVYPVRAFEYFIVETYNTSRHYRIRNYRKIMYTHSNAKLVFEKIQNKTRKMSCVIPSSKNVKKLGFDK